MIEKHQATLDKVPLFNGIEPEELSALLGCLGASVKSYSKNSVLMLAGQPVDSVGIVLMGQVHIVREDGAGRQSILSVLSEAELFGEAFACAGVEKSPVTVLAATDCEVMRIGFGRIVTSCPLSCTYHNRLVRNMLGIIANKNLSLNDKLRYLTLRTTREKLSAFLLSQMERAGSPAFTIGFNRSELADYLCIDRSAMSRELGRMRDEGLIAFDKSRFMVQDAASLGLGQ